MAQAKGVQVDTAITYLLDMRANGWPLDLRLLPGLSKGERRSVRQA